MKTAFLSAMCLCVISGCGGGGPLPSHSAMPIRHVSDAADEWLHDHCDVKKVIALDNDKVEPTAQSLGSNFVEVIYSEPGESSVVMFGCKDPLPANVGWNTAGRRVVVGSAAGGAWLPGGNRGGV